MENRESDNLEQSGITWIHLSDWHQGRKTDFDRTVVLGEPIEDIREREERIGSQLKQIDFIVFSGDLAFSGQKEEYEAAKIDLLDPVLEATGLSCERLFIVPGNHDLDRTAFDYLPSKLEKPFQSEADMKKCLVDERGRNRLLEPFETYREFVSQYTKQQQPDYGNIRRWTINGQRIALLGLNSALMAGRNQNEKGQVDDYGKLVVGEPQIYPCLNQIQQDHLRIAVLHHPFQWLAPFDSDRIESLLKRKFEFILCGHQHKPEIELVQGTQGKCIVIPGGATYASRNWANNYNFVHLDFDRDEGFKGLVYLRRWNGNRNEWTGDYETLGNGESCFPLYSPSTPAKKKTESVLKETPVRRNLPFDLAKQEFLIGRERELDRLEQLLINNKDKKVAVLYGGAGHGKSALASYFATNHEADFPHGLVGLKIAEEEEERKSPEDIARNLAKNFGWKEWELEGKNAASIMRDLFAERQMLLILDNADRGDDLRKLLPVGETCSIIITTRNTQLSSSLDLPAENGLEITTFKDGTDSGKDSSWKLLSAIIGAKLVEAEPEAARKIARSVDYLPLALKIVAVSIKNARTRTNNSRFSLEEYGKKLENDKTILTELQVSGDKDLNLEASLNFTWKILDLDRRQKERIKNFFACLGVCAAEGFSENTAIATGKYDDDWDEDNLAATLYLKKLCDYSLLNQLGDGRYLFHPLVRVYARTLANQLSLRQAAEKRHANYMVQLVKSMDFSHRVLGYDNEEEIDEAEQLQQALLQDIGVTDWQEELVLVEEFDAAKEINDIVVAAKWLGTKEKIDYEFADKLNLFFEEYGYWEEANTVISKFYALAIKQQDWERVIIFGTRQAKFLSLQGELANADKILKLVPRILEEIPLEDIRQRCEVKWLVRLGSIRQQQGKFEQALEDLNKSVDVAEELGDRELLRNSLTSLGLVLVKQKKLDDGVTTFKRVLEINQSFNHQRQIAMTLYRLGRVLQKQGKLDEAKDIFQQQLEIYRTLNDRKSIAIALNCLGGVLQEQGQLNEAKDIFQQQLEISRTLKDPKSIGIAFNCLGGVLQEQGQLNEAKDIFQQGLEISEALNDQHSIAIALNGLGGVLLEQGKLDEAKDTFQQELKIAQRLNDQKSIAIALNSLGGVLLKLNNLDEAKNAFQEQLKISETLNDQKQMAIALNGLGGVLLQLHQLDKAKDIFQQQLEISQTLKDQKEIAIALNSLGGVLLKLHQLDRAKDIFQQQLQIAQTLNDQKSEAIALNSLGGVLLQLHQLDRAKDIFQQQLEISQTLNDQKSEAIALNSLGGVLLQLHQLDRAKDIFQQQLQIAQTLNDQKSEAIALNSLGGVLLKLHQLDRAKDIFQQQLQISQTLNDQKSEAIALNSLGGVLLQLHQLDRAKDIFQEQLEICQTLNDQKSEAIALNSLGGVLLQLHQLDEAKDIFQQQLKIAQTLNDQKSEAIALNGLGGVLLQLHQLDEAKDIFQQQLKIAQTLNDQKQMAIALNGLGGVLLQLHQLDRAKDIFQEQLEICQTLNDQKQMAIALNGLGGVLLQLHQLDRAKDIFQEQLEICQTLNDRKQMAIALNSLGGVLLQLHQLDRAKDIFQQQLEIARTLNDQKSEAIALNGLGGVLLQQQELDRAKDIFQQQLKISQTLHDQKSEAIALNGLGGVLLQLHQLDEAKDIFQQQVEIAREINDYKELTYAFHGLGKVLLRQGKLREALQTFEAIIEISEPVNDQKSVAIALNGLGKVLQQQEKWQEAIDKFEQELAIGEPYYKPNQLAAKWSNLAELLHSQGELSKALEAFFHAAKFSEQQGKLNKAQAILLRNKNIYEEHQLNHGQTLADTLHLLGQVFQQKRQWQEAERYLLQSYSLQEKLPNLLQQARISKTIGELYSQKQDKFPLALMYLTEAFAIYEELKNINRLKEVTAKLTDLLAKGDRWEEAAGYCARVLALEPETEEMLKLQDSIANKSILQQGKTKSLIKLKGRVVRDN